MSTAGRSVLPWRPGLAPGLLLALRALSLAASLTLGGTAIAQDDRDPTREFVSTAEGDRMDLVRRWLERGADVNAPFRHGRVNAMDWALYRGNGELLALLLEFKASTDWKNAEGQGPLHIHAMKFSREGSGGRFLHTLRELIKAGAGRHAATADVYGRTPLHVIAERVPYSQPMNRADEDASHSTFAQTVRLLQESGADVNAVANDGQTALMMAVRSFCSPRAIRILMNAGATTTHKDLEGRTVLGFAQRMEESYGTNACKDVVRLLESARP